MNRTTLSLLFLLYLTIGWAQVIKHQQATTEDYIPLFKSMGYEVYSFDISELGKDSLTYHIQPIAKRYVGGVEEDYISYNISFESRTPKKVNKKITVSFSPQPKDMSDELDSVEIKKVNFTLSVNELELPLCFEKQVDPDGKKNTLYGSRPFKLDSVKIGEFIPLVLYGSAWFDDESKVFRFCGENEISPDMQEDIVKSIPEYYVIGVIIKK